MSTYSEQKRFTDWLKGEVQNPTDFSRDEITILSGQGVLTTGMILGKITSSGKWVRLDIGASDGAGAGTAAGILLTDSVDATSADQRAVAIVRDAVVSDNGIIWDTGVTSDAQKVTAKAQLASVGIIVRTGV